MTTRWLIIVGGLAAALYLLVLAFALDREDRRMEQQPVPTIITITTTEVPR